MKVETIDAWILVGVWLELGVGVFAAWLAWRGLQERLRGRIRRTVARFLKNIKVAGGRR